MWTQVMRRVFIALLLIQSVFGAPKYRRNKNQRVSNKRNPPVQNGKQLPILENITVQRRNDSVILILCRNSDTNAMKKTLVNFEKQFNKYHHYPYVFLNDNDWEDQFKNEICKVISGEAEFGKVPPEDWNVPEHIDRELAEKKWKKMRFIAPYAGLESYHNMCRFFSMKFFLHPLTLKYKYYWRVEPGVKFYCPIKEDPFEVMEQNNYQYGFTIVMNEYMATIPSLWKVANEFKNKNIDRIPPEDRRLKFMFNNDGNYNGLHFWSNFEIASFEFFRSDLYKDYVEYLDKSGGFYYERWGDAPVHSLAVALLMDKKKVHFFKNIGYQHDCFNNCPPNCPECDCNPAESINNEPNSPVSFYLKDQSE